MPEKPLPDRSSQAQAATAFIEAACAPFDDHDSGTLDEAETILAQYAHAAASIYSAAVLADEANVRGYLARDPASATAKGGPRGWDALTYLCFSRYLRLDRTRSNAFVRTARALLDAGANVNTGWIEMIDHPNPRPLLETAIYGAAGVAQHPELTRLLLLRKCDWHDPEGVRIVLEHGADPNWITAWGQGALHQAMRRDNALKTVEYLLDHGADATLPNREGTSAIVIAAHRGRGDALDLFERHGTVITLTGADALIAACARDHKETLRLLTAAEPQLRSETIAKGGTLLAEFSGVGNVAGVRNLLDLGVGATALYREGDGYFGIARGSTALHVAAWRAWPEVVKELIARGAPVNTLDGQGRAALQLAVKACVDSYWTERRSPDSVRALLEAGASIAGIEVPTGYDEVDELLR